MIFSGLLLVFCSFLIRVKLESYFFSYLFANETKSLVLQSFKIIALLPQSLIIFVACLLSVFREIFKKELEYNAAKLAESTRELELIKAKINPHFLLNTLNNIYAINYLESPRTSESILQLSKVLSFTIYKSKEKLIELQEEIELLQALIGLYQLKNNDSLPIQLTIENESEEEKFIPGFVLFSLLENAFKHSDLLTNESAFLRIHISVKNQIFLFEITNTISKKTSFDKNEKLSGGVGSKDINKMLKDQYADRFEYLVDSNSNQYHVKLIIYGF